MTSRLRDRDLALSRSSDRSESTYSIMTKFQGGSGGSPAMSNRTIWMCLTFIWTFILFFIYINQAPNSSVQLSIENNVLSHAAAVQQALKEWNILSSQAKPLTPSEAIKKMDPKLAKILTSLHISSKHYHIFVTHHIDAAALPLLSKVEVETLGLPSGAAADLWSYISQHQTSIVVEQAKQDIVEQKEPDEQKSTHTHVAHVENDEQLREMVNKINRKDEKKGVYNEEKTCPVTATLSYQGNTLGRPTYLPSLSACCARCHAHVECVGFTYNTATHFCILYNEILSEKRDEGDNFNGLNRYAYQTAQISGRRVLGKPTNTDIFITTDAVVQPYKEHVQPEWIIHPSPHPEQENRGFPHCPPMSQQYVPEHGRATLCTEQGIPHGAACKIECDEGYKVKGQVPICFSNNQYLFGAWGPPRVLCVKREEDPHSVALQYECDEDYPPGGVSTPYLLFGPTLAAVSPPALLIQPNCTQVYCTLSDYSFRRSILKNQDVLNGFAEFVAGLNSSFYPLPTNVAPLPIPDYSSHNVLEHFMDPTDTYSIWPPPIIILSLIFRNDRLYNALRTLSAIGYPLDRIYRFNAIYGNVGALACAASHWQASEWARKQGFKFFMVIEDDLFVRIPYPTFILQFNMLGWEAAETMRNEAEGKTLPGALNFHFDGMTFGGSGQAFGGETIPELGIQKIQASSLSTAYVINGKVADRHSEIYREYQPKHYLRLGFDLNSGMRADDIMSQLMGQQRWYSPRPQDWIKQTDGVSDLDFGFITREMNIAKDTDEDVQRRWAEWMKKREHMEKLRPRGTPKLPDVIPESAMHPGSPNKDTAKEKKFVHELK